MLLGRLPEAVLQHLLELLQHGLLDHDVLVVQVVDDVLVAALGVDVDYDGLDRRVALDENTCGGRVRLALASFPSRKEGWRRGRWCLPLMARAGMATSVKDHNHQDNDIRDTEVSRGTGGCGGQEVQGLQSWVCFL